MPTGDAAPAVAPSARVSLPTCDYRLVFTTAAVELATSSIWLPSTSLATKLKLSPSRCWSDN